MATAKQARSQQAAASQSTSRAAGAKRDAARGSTGAKRDKGTRGGRPDGTVVAPQARRPAGQQAKRPADKRPASAAPPARAEPVIRIPPRWFQLVTWALSIAGFGVSTYLTVAHYTSSSILACSDNGLVNCGLVTTSPQSMVFGVFPVAVLGLASCFTPGCCFSGATPAGPSLLPPRWDGAAWPPWNPFCQPPPWA